METVAVSYNEFTEFIPFNEIIHIQGSGSYSDIYLRNDRRITISKNLKWFESQLKDAFFERVHKSYLVNLSLVRKLSRAEGGKLCLINGVNIPVSNAKRKEIIQKIHDLNRTSQ